MLVYDGIKSDFLRSVESDSIAYEIEENIYQKMNRHTARNEFRAWENCAILQSSSLAEDVD